MRSARVLLLLLACSALGAAPQQAGEAARPAAEGEDAPASRLLGHRLTPYARSVRIRPGDTIQIDLKEDEDVRFSGEVSPAGLARIPYLGDFYIAGESAAEAERSLKQALEEKLYERATPSVVVVRRAPRYVQVYGAVGAPGRQRIDIESDSAATVVQAVTDAGGLESWGAPEKAFVLRSTRGQVKKLKMPVDLAKAFEAIDGPENITLQPDDVVFVPSAGSVSVVRRTPEHAYIYGAVKFPGRRAMPQVGVMTVMQAMIESGGLTSWAAPEDAYILRVDPKTGERTKIMVDVGQAMTEAEAGGGAPLRPNDLVFIPSKTAGASVLAAEPLEIIVSGEVGRPGMVLFEPGEQASFVRAIFKAGNFGEFAKTSAVRLVRYNKDGTRATRLIDARRIMEEGFLQEDFDLMAGDMIIVDEKRLSFR